MFKRIFFRSLFTLISAILFICIALYAQAQDKNNAAWMRHVKFGIMVHYAETLQNTLPPHNMGRKTSWDSCVNDFDVNHFAEQIHEIGAGYVIFTVYQGTQYMCIPNKTFEQLTGYKKGEATSHRDLIGDLQKALGKYNIKLILYVTADGTYRDNKSSVALSNPNLLWKQHGNKWIATKTWVNNWSKVLEDISLRYGRRIAGWWVDGAFTFHGFNDDLLDPFYRVLKEGNPNSVIAFNPSPQGKVKYYSKWDDYTAGEMYKLNDYPSQGGKINGVQWHILSFLGNDWKGTEVRFQKDSLTDYINKCNASGGVVTINVAVFRNGSIPANQVNFMKEVSLGVKPR